MRNVRDILASKGAEVWSISQDASVYQALGLMAERDVGALVVTDGERIAGILSERDYARKVVLHGGSSKEATVETIMSKDVMFVSTEQTIEEAMALMTDKRLRHLPVMRNGELCGMISIGDVVKAVIAEKTFVIEQLVQYIQAG